MEALKLFRPTAGGSGAWPRPIGIYYCNNKSKTEFRCSLEKPWPSRLQPRVGPPRS
jgi:hypothetical protein